MSEIQPSMSELEVQPVVSVFADFHVFIVFIIILNCLKLVGVQPSMSELEIQPFMSESAGELSDCFNFVIAGKVSAY